jgi:hypothetical protein
MIHALLVVVRSRSASGEVPSKLLIGVFGVGRGS